MPRVSATDWLNSQCADRLISVVLIGPSLAQVATSYRPTNTTESHQRPHCTFKEPFTTHTHTYIQHTIHTSTHNIYAQLSKYGIASHRLNSPHTHTHTHTKITSMLTAKHHHWWHIVRVLRLEVAFVTVCYEECKLVIHHVIWFAD